jgi:hypothetical protein
MRIFVFLFTLITSVSFNTYASEDGLNAIKRSIDEGEYKLLKGNKTQCPQGQLIISKKRKRLIFGTNLSFDLGQLEKATAENVPGGCKYRRLVSFKDGVLRRVIKMSKCHLKDENGTLVQKIKEQSGKLLYTSKSNGDRTLSCEYEKRGK